MKSRFLTQFVAGLAAFSMIAVQTPAKASPGCTGCNVRDEGVFYGGLVGQTVYVAGTAYKVTGVDASGGKVYLQDSAGQPKWSYASETYTAGAQNERMGVTTLIGIGILAMLGAAASSHSSGSSSSYNQPRETTQYYYYQQQRPTMSNSSSYTPPPSVSAPPINSFYSSCHGGSFYGC